jgi:hypothetical protein
VALVDLETPIRELLTTPRDQLIATLGKYLTRPGHGSEQSIAKVPGGRSRDGIHPQTGRPYASFDMYVQVTIARAAFRDGDTAPVDAHEVGEAIASLGGGRPGTDALIARLAELSEEQHDIEELALYRDAIRQMRDVLVPKKRKRVIVESSQEDFQ